VTKEMILVVLVPQMSRIAAATAPGVSVSILLVHCTHFFKVCGFKWSSKNGLQLQGSRDVASEAFWYTTVHVMTRRTGKAVRW
jgi:hypothetical protein